MQCHYISNCCAVNTKKSRLLDSSSCLHSPNQLIYFLAFISILISRIISSKCHTSRIGRFENQFNNSVNLLSFFDITSTLSIVPHFYFCGKKPYSDVFVTSRRRFTFLSSSDKGTNNLPLERGSGNAPELSTF